MRSVPGLEGEVVRYRFQIIKGRASLAGWSFSANVHVVQSESEVQLSRELLTQWAETCLRMNHLGTLIEREMVGKNGCERALDLTERARRRAWNLFNELVEQGARKPEN
jgi:hypothetical protein